MHLIPLDTFSVIEQPGASFFILFAYLDPGSGSILLQFLIASLAGGLLLIKIYFKKIKKFISHVFDRRSAPNDKESQQ